MLQMSFILKIFVYLAAFNTFHENNDETFVKLEIVNLCCSNFECSVTSVNWSNSPCEILATFRLRWEKEDAEKPILF